MQYVLLGGVVLMTGCFPSKSARVQTLGDAQISAPTPPVSGQESLGDLPNGQWVTSNIAVGGQPSKEDLKLLKDAGLDLVINFRRPIEMSFDERGYLAELGVRYVQFPIGGVGDFYQEGPALPEFGLEPGVVLGQVHTLLNGFSVDSEGVSSNGGTPRVLVHCASGNRVGAVFALMAYQFDQVEIEAALEHGRAHGLTGLASSVRSALESQTEQKEAAP